MQVRKINNPVPSLPTVKTASVNQESRLSRALDAAIGQTLPAQTEKVASEAADAPVGNVSTHLAKFAEDIASSQFDRQLAQVDRLGTAMADAFVRRIGAHEESAEKLAAAREGSMGLTHDEIAMIQDLRTRPEVFVQKVAQMSQDLYKRASHEKTAEEVYAEAANDTIRELHKLACECVTDGYRAGLEMLGAV